MGANVLLTEACFIFQLSMPNRRQVSDLGREPQGLNPTEWLASTMASTHQNSRISSKGIVNIVQLSVSCTTCLSFQECSLLQVLLLPHLLPVPEALQNRGATAF